VHNEGVAYKGCIVCMVLFCAYMQWSPVADLNYVWIHGNEHAVGAANPSQMANVLLPTLPQSVEASLDDSAYRVPPLSVTQTMEQLDPATILRL